MLHHPKVFKVTEIIEFKKRGLLLVNEEYQRGAIWTLSQEKLLIDSIFREYPIPKFYFHFRSSELGELSSKSYEIVDGQQRINAVYRYVNNGFKLYDPKKDRIGLPRFLGVKQCSWAGMTFESLPQELKDKFLNTDLQVSVVETDNINEVRELFVRLQSGLPLNAQEKRDAWPGELCQFVIKTAGKKPSFTGHDFWIKLKHSGTDKRGSLRKACAQVFMTFYSRHSYGNMFCGVGSQHIDEFYRHLLDFDPGSPGSMVNRFYRVLDKAYDVLYSSKRPPLRVHTVLHSILLIDALLDHFTDEWETKFPQALDRFLLELAKATKEKNETNEFWGHYGILARTDSTRKETISRRHQFFVKNMLYFMKPLKRKDPKRAFTREEKELVYFQQEKKCAKCGREMDWEDAEAHHIEAHTNGGPTVIENCQVLCTKCHPRGSGSYGNINKGKKENPLGWDNDELNMEDDIENTEE
ncbi:MAG: DUF262 domain-containing protein [Desulfobacteraceae bacterium]|nr:DUF262 domain-containing protein [Desulfobacteraceae bacterium]